MRLQSPSSWPTVRPWLCFFSFALVLWTSELWAQTALELRQAAFSRDAATPEQPVQLPDTWKQRGLAAEGFGRYRLTFDLPDAPPEGQAWALRAERLSRMHRVWINGVLVHETGDTPDLRIHASAVPSWLEIPARLLRAGSNELVLELYHRRRGGLSTLWIGPASQLEPGHQWDRLRQAVLPQWVNMLAAGFSLLLLLLWAERRQERALGLFALLSLITSLRNCAYGLTLPHHLIPALDLFYYLAQAMSVLLLGFFAMAWSERSLPHYRKLLSIAAPLLLIGGPAAAWWGQLEPWRTWVYPMLMLMALPALWLILAHARQVGGWRRGALAGALLLMMGAALFDYLVGQGRLAITHSFAMPWIQPLAMIAFASLLAERLVVALRQSERHQAELERMVGQRTAELQAADLAKTRLLDAASHDLRQPVTAVGLQLGMARKLAREPAQLRLLDRALQGLQSLEELLKGLLDYSRLSRGDAAAVQGPVRIQALFDSIGLHAEPLARARGLRLRVRPSPAWVSSDALLLEQILRNLLSNAIQHTERGGVLLALRRRGSSAWIEVRDSGPGIAPQDQQRIFEPFVQLKNPARAREQGTGLGLAIVQQATRRLGHTLELHSNLGRGSCFRLVLPLAQAPAPLPDDLLAADATTERPPLPGQTVWMVEDDGALREALCEQMARWGLSVRAFADAESLLDALPAPEEAPPDWVLSDLRLPGTDGASLLTHLLARWPGLRATLMTAERDPPAGRWTTLHKPFRPSELARVLQPIPADRPS